MEFREAERQLSGWEQKGNKCCICYFYQDLNKALEPVSLGPAVDQFRDEIGTYIAHLYGLLRDDLVHIPNTFPVLKKKEKKAFGEFMSKRKCFEEYDRIGKVLANESFD
jgi:hypothetical protein